MRRLIFILAGLFPIASGPVQAAISCPSAASIVSRSSGTAPLYVFFDATATSDSSLTGTNQSFRDLYYSWNFADSSAGAWATDGTSKNTANGPMAAHLFTTAGSFSPTLTVTNAAGQSCTVTVSTITATDPSTTWAGAATACVRAASTDFNGCPAGAAQYTNSDYGNALNTAISGGSKRILFRGGDTFTSSSGYTVVAGGPGYIGSFGSGQATLDVTTATNSVLTFGSSAPDWRVVNLNFTGASAGSVSDSSYGIGNASTMTQLTLWQNTFQPHFYISIGMNDYAATNGKHVQPGIIENTVNTQGSYGIYGGLTLGGILGNTITINPDMNNDGHNIRMNCVFKFVAEHNMLSCPNGCLSTNINIAGGQGDGQQVCLNPHDTSEFFLVSDNQMTMGGSSSGIPLVFGPQNSTASGEVIEDGIAERNFVNYSEQNYSVTQFAAQRVVVRNNIFYVHTGSSLGTSVINLVETSPNSTAGNQEVYNNTIYQSMTGGTSNNILLSDSSGSFGHGTAISNSTVRNNLLYSPLVSATFVSCGGTNCVADHNLQVTANPFAASSPSLPTDFKLSSSSPAIQAGASGTGVLVDYGLQSRPVPPSLGAWDVTSSLAGALGAPGQPTLVP